MSTPVSTTSLDAVLDQGAHLRHHLADRHRAAVAAAVGDDAEGAAVVAALLDLDEGAACARRSRRSDAPAVSLTRHDVGDRDARRVAARRARRSSPPSASRRCRARGRPPASPRSASGAICAAQPVTMMRAPGLLAPRLRIAWRAWRSASAVTAQVLTMTASLEPGGAGMAAHHLGLEGVEPAAEGDDLGRQATGALQLSAKVDLAAEARRAQPPVMSTWSSGSHSISSSPPSSTTVGAAAGQLAPRRRDQGRAGAAAAGLGDAGAALPDPQADAVRDEDLREADIGALGEQRMALEHRPQAGEVDRLRVGHEEHRVRIATLTPTGSLSGPTLSGRCRVSQASGKRDLAPVQLGRAHVDRDAPAVRAPRYPAGRRWSRRWRGCDFFSAITWRRRSAWRCRRRRPRRRRGCGCA